MNPDIKQKLFDIFADMGFNLIGEEIDDFHTSLNEAGLQIGYQPEPFGYYCSNCGNWRKIEDGIVLKCSCGDDEFELFQDIPPEFSQVLVEDANELIRYTNQTDTAGNPIQ